MAQFLQIPGLSPAVPVTDEFALQQRSGLRRVVATSSHPIEYGVVLAIVLPIALHLALTATDGEAAKRWACVGIDRRSPPRSRSPAPRSSGSLVGMLAMWCGWAWDRKKTAIKVAIVYLVLTRLLVDGLLGAIKNMFLHMSDDPSYQGRTMDYVLVGEDGGRRALVRATGSGTFDPQRLLHPRQPVPGHAHRDRRSWASPG